MSFKNKNNFGIVFLMKRIILFLLLTTIAFPISLITNTGSFYTGSVLEETEDYIVLMSDTGVYEIYKDDIKEKIITFDANSSIENRDFSNKNGLRFSFSSGLGGYIPVHDNTQTYSDGTTKNVYINQLSELGIFYSLGLNNGSNIEFGVGVLNRITNVRKVSNKNGFSCNFVSFTFRKTILRSFNGGYLFNLGAGASLYSNAQLRAFDGSTNYHIAYKDAIGYHLLAEIWSNIPKVWVFNDLNFVMGLRWNFGTRFDALTSPVPGYPLDWNSVDLNGFLFNSSIVFLW